MQVIEFHETPEPFLVMPYYPLGNLQDLKDVTQEQYVSAFCQILLGLHHLHERGVVHRDLKPENLLVAAPFTIIIADFGLSKMATNGLLTTFCGTHLYAAPEVYPGNSAGYGPAVDIWSTGVIFLAFIYDPPGQPDMKGVTPEKWNMHWSKHWSKALVNKVNDFEDDDRVIDILINMVKIQPEERFTAEQCLQRGCSNGLFRKRNDGHIIGAEEALDDNNTETVNVSDEASNDGGTTPTEQSALGSDIRGSNALHASANLDGHFHRRELRNSPTQCIQTIPVGGSNSGPPTRREMTTSWSWTIGPSSSGPDDLTGLFIKKDCFTSSLESKRTINDLQDDGPPSDDGRAVPKRGSDIPPDPASFEERILELLVGK
jgi:serine/threonine protein kinase